MACQHCEHVTDSARSFLEHLSEWHQLVLYHEIKREVNGEVDLTASNLNSGLWSAGGSVTQRAAFLLYKYPRGVSFTQEFNLAT